MLTILKSLMIQEIEKENPETRKALQYLKKQAGQKMVGPNE